VLKPKVKLSQPALGSDEEDERKPMNGLLFMFSNNKTVGVRACGVWGKARRSKKEKACGESKDFKVFAR
jgi:hypothetical protein